MSIYSWFYFIPEGHTAAPSWHMCITESTSSQLDGGYVPQDTKDQYPQGQWDKKHVLLETHVQIQTKTSNINQY